MKQDAGQSTQESLSEGGWATLSDVAKHAGVSAMTVSRVLKSPSKVAETTRERVRHAIESLGYVPDNVAGSLASRSSRLIAALISTVAGSVFVSTIEGLNAALAESGHQLLLGTTQYSAESEEALLTTVLGRRPDGLVLTSSEHTERTRAMLTSVRLPVVEIWDLPEHPIDSAVGFSNREAGAAMTRLLAELGYRHIAFLGGLAEGDWRGYLRSRGYTEVLAELGMGAPRCLPVPPAGVQGDTGAAGLSQLLERWPNTDCVFCASDALALGALAEARRRGMAVPGALAIAGFGDFEFAGNNGVSLTTVRVPGKEIGYQTGKLILARKLGHSNGPARLDLGFELVRRASA
ncbi:LacI family DNA-binding transcriptional regulator [Aquibaculum sediminis]|uniref:LacI family DNA-binding transcriptional regulator n=1 Tax=Aquibaculum sediminis TaxID=3231907 RepID=UPI003454A543